jgi:hypothetical protein
MRWLYFWVLLCIGSVAIAQDVTITPDSVSVFTDDCPEATEDTFVYLHRVSLYCLLIPSEFEGYIDYSQPGDLIIVYPLNDKYRGEEIKFMLFKTPESPTAFEYRKTEAITAGKQVVETEISNAPALIRRNDPDPSQISIHRGEETYVAIFSLFTYSYPDGAALFEKLWQTFIETFTFVTLRPEEMLFQGQPIEGYPLDFGLAPWLGINLPTDWAISDDDEYYTIISSDDEPMMAFFVYDVFDVSYPWDLKIRMDILMIHHTNLGNENVFYTMNGLKSRGILYNVDDFCQIIFGDWYTVAAAVYNTACNENHEITHPIVNDILITIVNMG